MRTVVVDRCPACRSTQLGGFEFGPHKLQHCAECGLVSAAEVVAPDEIYVEGYMTSGTGFGPPSVTDPQFQRFLNGVGHRRVGFIEREVAQPSAGPLLDVGCGTGDLLVAAKERGWDVVGVEPVEESVELARSRGVDVRSGLLETSGIPQASFAVVTAYHVVEHMSDATEFLRLLSRWARPGGHVVVEVPNWRSVDRRRAGTWWPLLAPMEHVAYYTPATLASLMSRAGLDSVRTRTMTFLHPSTPHFFQLRSLGLSRLSRVATPFTRPGGSGHRYARAPLRAAMALTAAVYDRAKVGQVAVAVGRLPHTN